VGERFLRRLLNQAPVNPVRQYITGHISYDNAQVDSPHVHANKPSDFRIDGEQAGWPAHGGGFCYSHFPYEAIFEEAGG
jgi:hypothetical protein